MSTIDCIDMRANFGLEVLTGVLAAKREGVRMQIGRNIFTEDREGNLLASSGVAVGKE
jgi:hypothetical protein